MLKLRLGTIMLILGGGRGKELPAAPASSDRSGINGARPPHMAAVIFGQPWDGIWLRMTTVAMCAVCVCGVCVLCVAQVVARRDLVLIFDMRWGPSGNFV